MSLDHSVTAIGVDLGGTNLRVGLVSGDGQVLDLTVIPTPKTGKQIVCAIVDRSTELAKHSAINGIGVGVPGRLTRTGTVVSAGFVDLSGFDLRREIEDRVRLPLVLHSDAQMALIAEAELGAATGCLDALLITVGTGIGGAAVSGGSLLSGAANAGQFGHIMVEPHGQKCLCGRRGCLETTSSGSALRRLLVAEGMEPDYRVEDLLLERDVSEKANRVLTKWTDPLVRGIESLTAAFDPEIVVLGGGLGSAAYRAMRGYSSESSWFTPRIEMACLGDSAGVVGAGLLGCRVTLTHREVSS